MSSNKNIIAGGRGLSFDDAIIINSSEPEEGIAAEFEYILNIFTGTGLSFEVFTEDIVSNQNKRYDIITIRVFNCYIYKFYFDITSFHDQI
jgi:hypothetical protein